MKKTPIILLASTLLGALLASCGGPSSSSNPPVPPQQSSTLDEQQNTNESKTDFTPKHSCDAGSFDKESYLFTAVEQGGSYWGDMHDPKLIITINQNDWAYVTGVNEEVVLLSENESVIPSSAISFDATPNSNTGMLTTITVRLDRTKFAKGTTKIKVVFKAANGASSASLLDLCVPVEVKDFGAIQVLGWKTNFEVDVNDLPAKYDGAILAFAIQDDAHEYGSPYKAVQSFPMASKKVTIENAFIPEGHPLKFFIQIDLPDGSYKAEYVAIGADSSFNVVNGEYRFTAQPTSPLTATYLAH